MVTVSNIEIDDVGASDIDLVKIHAGDLHVLQIGRVLNLTVDGRIARRLQRLLAKAFPEEHPF